MQEVLVQIKLEMWAAPDIICSQIFLAEEWESLKTKIINIYGNIYLGEISGKHSEVTFSISEFLEGLKECINPEKIKAFRLLYGNHLFSFNIFGHIQCQLEDDWYENDDKLNPIMNLTKST